jgi:hypothetical protein
MHAFTLDHLRGYGLVIGLTAALLGVGPDPAEAAVSTAVKTCIATAYAEHKECKQTCAAIHADARDECQLKDPECIRACLAGREDCRDATGLASDVQVCHADREAAVAQCRAAFAADTPERDTCVDAAQLTSFVCRDDAREANRAELRLCGTGFRGCRRECPRVADPPTSPAECRSAARAEYVVCRDECKEDYQLAKDACRGLDHTCVETCRSDRDACRTQADDQLGALIDACNATRDAQIATCGGEDACIDAAQAAAFQCRDQAREDMKPSFEACRAAFHECVVGPPGCPAAAP